MMTFSSSSLNRQCENNSNSSEDFPTTSQIRSKDEEHVDGVGHIVASTTFSLLIPLQTLRLEAGDRRRVDITADFTFNRLGLLHIKLTVQRAGASAPIAQNTRCRDTADGKRRRSNPPCDVTVCVNLGGVGNGNAGPEWVLVLC